MKSAVRVALAALLAAHSLGVRTAHAQDGATLRARRDRDAFVAEQRALMWTLIGWAATSVAVGAVMVTKDDDAVRWAGIQNLAWGGVNAGIATFSLFNLARDAREEKTELEWRQERAHAQRTFTWNAGLDVLYVGVGTALLVFAKDEGLRGAGAAVIVQGGFLLAFDSTSALVVRPSLGNSSSAFPAFP